MKRMSKTRQAVNWIMCAPPGEMRTQAQAALLFRVSQSAISVGLKRYVPDEKRPDARRREL